MKKLIIFLAIAFIGFKSTAQGLKAGVNFANFSGSDAGDEKTLVSFYAGVMYNIMISDMFSIEPQLMYSGQGAKDEDDLKLLLGYILFNPLFRYNTQSGLFVGTGPQVGFLLSAKVKQSGNSADVKDQFKGTDFAWAFAVGYDMPNGFGIYGRYNLGLSNIVDQDDADLKNSVIQIGFRYTLKNKKQ